MTKLLFFRAQYGGWGDLVIDRFTGRIGYSHVAIVEEESPYHYMVIEAMQGYGVRRRRVTTLDMRWDVVTLPYDESEVIHKARKQIGKQYDWVGLFLNWVVPIQRFFKSDLDSGKKWWCSELVAHCIGIKPDNISPNRLYLEVNGHA